MSVLTEKYLAQRAWRALTGQTLPTLQKYEAMAAADTRPRGVIIADTIEKARGSSVAARPVASSPFEAAFAKVATQDLQAEVMMAFSLQAHYDSLKR